jgi:hypothetical protein
MPTQCIYELHAILTLDRDFFQTQLTGLCNGLLEGCFCEVGTELLYTLLFRQTLDIEALNYID